LRTTLRAAGLDRTATVDLIAKYLPHSDASSAVTSTLLSVGGDRQKRDEEEKLRACGATGRRAVNDKAALAKAVAEQNGGLGGEGGAWRGGKAPSAETRQREEEELVGSS
jgi:hypothetical protein